jgi:hypothetical protein
VIVPPTSATKGAATLTLTVVGDYPVPSRRLWTPSPTRADPSAFGAPPPGPPHFTRHDFTVGGRAQYFLTGPKGDTWSGSWKLTALEQLEESIPGMERGLRAAMPQLDAVLAERRASATHA